MRELFGSVGQLPATGKETEPMGNNHAKCIKQRTGREYREKEEAKCKEKIKYPSAKAIGEGRGKYECPWCGSWHATHRKPAVVKRGVADRAAQEVLDQFR